VTLTVTDTSSHQESQTYYFVIPPGGNEATMPTSASWPVTLPPDTVEPGAPAIASQGVSVDADSGALDSSIPLPGYNPNVPALALTYNSLTADPRPIVVVHHTLDATQSVPSKVNATLTFNGTAGTTWYYDTSQFIPGDIQQMALQANATTLSTNRYSYSVQVVDQRSTNTTFTYSGSANVLNQSTSAFGDGWTLQGLEQVITPTGGGGVILALGGNGESLWFSGSPGTGQNYTSPAGDFSTLTKTASGWTRTLPDGTQITFDSNGNESATIDLNGLHTTYTFSSGLLTKITDPYGGVTTFSYSSNKLSSIQDPSARLTSFTFSGNNLAAVQQVDGSHITYTYDSSGRMTSIADERAKVTTITYDSAEGVGTITRPDATTQLVSADQEQGWTNSGTSASPAAATLLAEAATNSTSPIGNTSQIRPDWYGLGQLAQATDALGDVTTNDLNSKGLPIAAVDGLNRITQSAYDSLGNPTTIWHPDLNTDQYTYNSDSEPLTHTDANNHTTSYTYDSHGNVTVVHDAMNNLTTLTYTANGRLQTSTDANSKTTTYLYDSQDRVTTIQFPDGTTNLLAYNAAGQVTQATDGRGNATTYAYDALNRKTGMTDALGNHTTILYDAAGNMTQQQLPTPSGQTARTTSYAYDSMDRVTTVTDPLGNATVTAYDADGNTVTVTDPLGRVTTNQYDALDRETVVIDPMGNAMTTTYDADGETLTVTDALNRTTSYAYSVRGWVATVTDPLGNVATYTYSATGKQTGEYQSQLFQTQTSSDTYDADDRLSSSTDGLGNTTTYTYDGVGNQVTVKDPNGNVVTSVYDSRNRLVETIEPQGVTVSYTYDNSGNQQTATDALGHTTTTLYDALDRATTLISAVVGITTIVYDAAGRQTSLQDPVGNTTTWAYDADDRVTTVTDPNGATVTSVYDADGELTDTTDQDGRRTTFAYDKDGAQTGESWLNGSGSAIYIATYTFDADHEMTGVTDPYATLTFTYDKDGHVVTMVTSGPGTGQPTVTLSYSYDQVGDETSLTDSLSNQGVISYTYNLDQKVTQITQSFGGTVGPQVTFGYDYASRLTTTSRQIGTSSTATEVNTSVGYDAANRVVTMADSQAVYSFFGGGGWATTPLATQVYSYDNASRVTAETDKEGTASFTYDSTDELTGVTGSRSESYSYDLNGNRTGTGYSTGTMNEVTTAPGHTYTYDNTGNRISDNNGTTITTYSYDYENRLTSVTTGGTVVATYTYNALGQRIGVKDSGTQTWTAYDGPSAGADPYADFNGSGSLSVRYLIGPTMVNGTVTTGILGRTSAGGTTAWYLADKLGSVRDIVDTSGNELDHIVYDSFGNILSESGPANGDRFKFYTSQYDVLTFLYFTSSQYYSSYNGMFIQQTPMAFMAGDSNLYGSMYISPTSVIALIAAQQGGTNLPGSSGAGGSVGSPPIPPPDPGGASLTPMPSPTITGRSTGRPGRPVLPPGAPGGSESALGPTIGGSGSALGPATGSSDPINGPMPRPGPSNRIQVPDPRLPTLDLMDKLSGNTRFSRPFAAENLYALLLKDYIKRYNLYLNDMADVNKNPDAFKKYTLPRLFIDANIEWLWRAYQ
jgi:YD repeat-containing protein